ncbi:hypothetical protein C1Y08_01145 [Pseudomonas sp. FW306-02-F02-AA]|uniref:Integrase n=2 Tax=Pseudomonas TaxID=286 RepID=A0A0N9VU33_PSEFL|nr:hypothetical protein AO353_24645 [Pseudomonas fluorescens]PMZ02181.1 hypothetical protein C1Y07_21590 [Pseudomonas sp. FW306-02-F02-AB]PMZ07836.1 hypothetical protein C1Y06_22395 [Pseudomonas sp. FW306-02-H06C]PMZ17946.1 hypothetical protein C1Y08_01145 [Pseudomonas sp. FW306-02-F02-AA]PMZ23979.1 hypothetical protein C1Y09_01150 [Pseudomonas sp. FW306-02-F08-AA]PMZ29819.1 hypothetical protein C1Y05_01145 [Pseudomonas sp. FW306-02-F04-BA]PMZ31364.1 hypothetical protein C1X99_26940 [Pseudomo
MKYGIKLHTRATPTPAQQFDSDYMEFAKAFLLNNRRGDPTKAFRVDYLAVQIIDAALIEVDGYADITRLSPIHLEKAVEIIKKRKKGHLNAAVALQSLVRVVAQHNITSHSLKYWEHPFSAKGLGKSEKPEKASLPDDDALLAFAEIFSRGYHGDLDDESVYVSSITAILLSVPMRIAEKLRLRLDSLKSETDKKGVIQWYLHYYSTKNKKMVTKGIPAVMADHCREAFRRLESITKEARKLALHLESGSTDFFPHPEVPDVPADQILTPQQVLEALGRPSPASAETLMKHLTGRYELGGWTLNTLWKLISAYNMRKNPFFPYQVNPDLYPVKPPKMSESLLCFLKFQLSELRATSPVLIAPTTQHHYSTRVAPSKVSAVNGKIYDSFLSRHGYPDTSIRSHQLRHFLNTAAKEAGQSIEFITHWSGRASVKQTRDYIHQDPKREARKLSDSLIPVADVTPEPITAAEYDIRDKGPIIATRYGICMHAWTTSACQKSGDCLNCSDLLHCKGHKNSLQAVKVERDHVAENLGATLKEIEAGNRPATRWVETHTFYLERLNQIVTMHENPDIPDGSPMQMVGKDFTHAKRILAKKQPQLDKDSVVRDILDNIYDDDLRLCLNEMMGTN